VADGLTERRRADARLHVEIAAAAQSPRLTREEISLWSQIGDLLWLPLSSQPQLMASVIAEHDELVDAIADEDGKRARELACAHVNAETERLADYRLALGES